MRRGWLLPALSASALLMALPFIGVTIVLLQDRKSNYQSWLLFGFRYRV